MVVVDGRAERLQIVSSRLIADALRASPIDILAAGLASDLCQGLVAPPLNDWRGGVNDPIEGPRMRCVLAQIDVDYVCAGDAV